MSDTTCWRVISASVTGAHHIRMQRGCEDAYYPRYDDDVVADTFVCAVADGLGSASHAAQGADCAVINAVNIMQARLEKTAVPLLPEVMVEVFQEVQRKLVQLAVELEVSSSEVACTLQLVVMSAKQLLIGHVGDGLVLGVRSQRTADDMHLVEMLSMMENKDFANLTYVMVDSDIATHIQVTDIRQESYNIYDGVVLMTDGAQSLCFEYEIMKPYEPFFAQLITWINNNTTQPVGVLNQQLAEFFTSDDARQQSGDDITFVMTRVVGA